MGKKKKIRPIFSAFWMLLRNVMGDGMLAALLVVPILFGAALRYGLPALLAAIPVISVVGKYKPLWDALLFLMAPYMTLFACAMVTLEERDNGCCVALYATPLGRIGYFASHFLLPALLALVYVMAIGIAFSSAQRPFLHTLLLAVLSTLVALSAILPMLAFAKDKIAGMAISKLCSLLLLTVSIPFFLPYEWQPFLSWLPSYWFYRFLMVNDWLMLMLCAAVSLAWALPMMRQFSRGKVTGFRRSS